MKMRIVTIPLLTVFIFASLNLPLSAAPLIPKMQGNAIADLLDQTLDQSTPANTTPGTKENKNQSLNDDDINRFTNTIALIRNFYVQKTGERTLLDDAIRGMVSGLDPHSEYLDQEAYKTLLMATSGEFGGVGIEVTPEYGVLKII